MSSQHSTQSDMGGALVPALILFGGLTLLLIGLLAARPNNVPAHTNEATATSASVSAETTAAVAEATEAAQTVAVALDPAKVKAGESSFQTICSACHGFNAMGIPGLGKTLIGSKFVNSQTDDQLLAFLQVGRAVTDPLNTTGVQMPARGGNPSFTDDKLMEIIAYIRSLNQNAAASGANATATPAPTSSSPTAVGTESSGFALPDLSGLAVPTSISGGGEATAEATADTGFALPDLSSLPVPTSISGGTSSAVSTPVPAEATVEATAEATADSGFALPDLSSLPVPTSLPK